MAKNYETLSFAGSEDSVRVWKTQRIKKKELKCEHSYWTKIKYFKLPWEKIEVCVNCFMHRKRNFWEKEWWYKW